MNFSSIPGQEEIKAKLIGSVKSNHLAHALLFAGKPGSLNLPLALAFAQYLHCQNKGEADSCGACPACSKSLKYIHPDTNFVFPVGNIKGDKDDERFKAEILKTWRSFLLERPFGNLGNWMEAYGGEDKQANISREESREIIRTLSLKPFESPHKVMIIWMPELMHPSASNGILKILEEPPPHTFFLLVTNAAEQLMATILSRTQKIQVPLLPDDIIESYLKEKHQVEEPKLNDIIQLAEGDLNFAIDLIESDEDHHQHKFIEWMRLCFKKDYSKLSAFADEFHEADKLSQHNLLHYGLGMFRETLLQVSGANKLSRAKGPEAKFVQDFSRVLSLPKIEKVSKLINDSTYHLERNGSAKMIFMDLSIQVSKVFNP